MRKSKNFAWLFKRKRGFSLQFSFDPPSVFCPKKRKIRENPSHPPNPCANLSKNSPIIPLDPLSILPQKNEKLEKIHRIRPIRVPIIISPILEISPKPFPPNLPLFFRCNNCPPRGRSLGRNSFPFAINVERCGRFDG